MSKKNKQKQGNHDWWQLATILTTSHEGFNLTSDEVVWLDSQPKIIRKAVHRFIKNVNKSNQRKRQYQPKVKTFPKDFTYPMYGRHSLYDICEYRGKTLLNHAWRLDLPIPSDGANILWDEAMIGGPYFNVAYFPTVVRPKREGDDTSKFAQITADSICKVLDFIRNHKLWLTTSFKISLSAPSDTASISRTPVSKEITCSWTDCDGSMLNSEMILTLYKLIYAVIPSEVESLLTIDDKRLIAKLILGYISLLTDDLTNCTAEELQGYNELVTNPIIIPCIYNDGTNGVSILSHRTIEIVNCFATVKDLETTPAELDVPMTSIANYLTIYDLKENNHESEGNAE